MTANTAGLFKNLPHGTAFGSASGWSSGRPTKSEVSTMLCTASQTYAPSDVPDQILEAKATLQDMPESLTCTVLLQLDDCFNAGVLALRLQQRPSGAPEQPQGPEEVKHCWPAGCVDERATHDQPHRRTDVQTSKHDCDCPRTFPPAHCVTRLQVVTCVNSMCVLSSECLQSHFDAPRHSKALIICLGVPRPMHALLG